MDKKDVENLMNAIKMTVNVVKNEFDVLEGIDKKDPKKTLDSISKAIDDFLTDLKGFK
ncbi:hypothetical protein Mia14_0853 [Candidatus Mancarchaeum acidiphilum]|uniref:Uncharacterized protein n=1 Tax=Candidatus Mancarchaeum acidiphilum TaxID=1920749 RepID=A0A218NNS9_9ARCH|nr:hypothetical protein [Candidatus Mancarchaeum acidiphilum]ASI14138.1 hypothetical protein Mia14_0853 [Candidatus Mancarchaeum acidiphilum]